MPPWLRRLLDGLAFTSLIPAGVAASLLLAAGDALGRPSDWLAAGLAGCGTVFVYGVDRLRGAPADREKAPFRTAFVERHRAGLRVLTVTTGMVAAALALALPHDVQLLCVAVAGAGLLHRRLKHFAIAVPLYKPLYVAAAWVAVTAGIPALGAPYPDRIGWVLAIYAGAISANLFGSNDWPRAALLLAAAGAVLALCAPHPLLPLAAIPACELAVLTVYRPGERYTLIGLDGALLLGGILALFAGR